MRGGISSYAGQWATRLREEGHQVVLASPEPSDANLVLDVRRRRSGVRLVRLARRCDRLIVQFQPEMLGEPDASRRNRAAALLRLGAGMWAARSCELCIHEVDYGRGTLAPLLRFAARLVWQLADVLTVHTERERRDFAGTFRIREDKIRVVGQGAHLLRRADMDQAAARAALGLPASEALLLSIGFLQPHKGFDRAVRAFAELSPKHARLYVIGSIWREDSISMGYVEKLRRVAAETLGVELREGYLQDAEFDRWIVAADALVLPYRRGWSSNVMERGLLFDRPVIMARVGGMAEQGSARPGVTLFSTGVELRDAMRRAIDEALGAHRSVSRRRSAPQVEGQ